MTPRSVALALALLACSGGPRVSRSRAAVETAGATPEGDARAKVTAPARVEAIPVPGDLPASIVRPLAPGPLRAVFLPGVCSNAAAYLQSFPEAARVHGGVLAIDGDEPCEYGPGFHTFSWSTERQHARIEAALAAAGVSPREEGLVLVGYSQGATISEKLVHAHPRRYTAAVLIAAPVDPSVPSLRTARAVVTSACSLDVTGRMRDAAARLRAAGVPAGYVEMPGCTHGNVADAERTFDWALGFLETEGGRQK